MNEEKVLLKAELNPVVKKYWLIGTVLITSSTVVGIPLLILIIPTVLALMTPYFNSIECILTEKSIIMRKGILNKVEKTVPLEKITDVSLTQGPIMRMWGLHKISIETAGTNQVGQAFLSITGIKDTITFRNAIFEQREIFLNQKKSDNTKTTVNNSTPSNDVQTLLLDQILKTLNEIKDKLPDK
jgi:putative membrane protein